MIGLCSDGPPPTTRERPPGCRTIFVGGLPENITEEIIREVFQRCGQIVTVRMSKKNFCHIRFDGEAYVDNAIFLSGKLLEENDTLLLEMTNEFSLNVAKVPNGS